MGVEDQQQLGRIEAKLDAALAVDRDHEERLRGLEKLRWQLHGMWVVIAAVVTFIVSKLG